MGRPRATRSLSEHGIKDMSVPFHPDLVPHFSLQYAFSDAENDPDQAWLSPPETYQSFDMAVSQATMEKSDHFNRATDVNSGHPTHLSSRSGCSEDSQGLMSSDHEFAFESVRVRDHADLHQGFDQPVRQDGRMAEVFLKLSSLQFDLQRRREQLTGPESGHNFITRAAGLDSIMCTISDVCRVARDQFSKGTAWRFHDSKHEPLPTAHESSLATFMLILMIVLEALNIYEVLVRNSSKDDPVTLRPKNSYEISAGPNSMLPRTLSSVAFPATPESCSSSSERDVARASIMPPAMTFAIGSFMSCEYLNEILVLTAVDLHLSLFDCFFHRFKNQALAPSVMSSVDTGKTRTSQLRLKIKTIIEVSKQCWNST
ncbi:hypothetical protein MMC17_007122 [Xylographa soralifera]|nr:hypothetical protein [Xylographa soralifera]